jgi:acyl-CoA hydrolase
VKVGDLVELESWCKNKGRRGIIIEVREYLGCVKIRYLDTGEISNPMTDNLKVLSESR